MKLHNPCAGSCATCIRVHSPPIGAGAAPPPNATIYAYGTDGFLVAEAPVIIEPDRVAYVFLVPNGFK
jgi:hypothetical protein